MPVIPKQIENGSYTAVLESVNQEPGKFGQMTRWNWLLDVDGTLTPHQQLTSGNFGSESLPYKILSALIGRPLQAGEDVDWPIGKRATLVIERQENPRKKDGKLWATVVDVQPYSEPQQTIEGLPR